MKGREENAYLTVCLALCLAIILSLFLVLLDGARRNGARLELECVADIGLQSILAEYHRELMRQYNMFAVDNSYGTTLCSKSNTEAHLRKYLKKNLEYEDVFLPRSLYGEFFALSLEQAELTKVSIMSDGGGAVFRKCAADAIKADVGLELLQELQGWVQEMEVNGLEGGDAAAESARLDEEIAGYDGMEVEIEEGEWETVEVSNPAGGLNASRSIGILSLVVENGTAVSQNAVRNEVLISSRMRQGQVNQGNIPLESRTVAESIAERFLFQEYLLRYMGRYGAEHEEDALRYQIEYVIAGNGNDVDNLKNIANRLLAIREAANAAYLWSNGAKRAEIAALAALVCSVASVPSLTTLLEAAILLGWAYAESVYDVKSLLAGGRVPLVKDDSSWHYGLSAALGGVTQDSSQGGVGLSYEDYLRIFMMMLDEGTLAARAMDMAEADIRQTPGNAAFRLDGCYVALEAAITVGSRHGYHYEIVRNASY